MSENFMIYGATGYTGQLVARQAVEQGMRPLLAARSAQKLAPVAEGLNLEYRAFSLDDPTAMDAALSNVAVLLNCAGPFSRTAGPLVDSCLRAGTHYLDLAGEAPEFEALAKRDSEAKAAGVMLMPGAGFGVVPTDCLAAYLKSRLPSATHLVLAFETIGGVSQGTALTLFKDLHTTGVRRQNGELAPARPAEKSRDVDFGQGPTRAVTNPWRGDIATAFYTTGIPNIETYSAFPAPAPQLMAAGPYLGWLWNSAPAQGLLKWLVGFLPVGPDDGALAKGQTRVWGEVTDGEGRSFAARLHGPEAYLFTALTALTLVKRILGDDLRPGFQTPAGVYGADLVLDIKGVAREDIS